jgi:ribose-phosphate pyrophosphokinase
MLIFSTDAYQYLKDEVLPLVENAVSGEVHSKLFPDGERYHRIVSDVSEQDVVLIGGTTDDANTMELYDIACGLAQNGARQISIFIPYFGYSTMERMVQPGEIIKAQSRALLFSSIPSVQSNLRIFLFDLHSEGIPYYFDRHVRTHHIYCKPIILSAARHLGGSNFVLAATDAGRAKWVESLALELGVESAFAYKQRIDGESTAVTGVNANVAGKHVIIYDDMIRTGGSLVSCAEVYKQMGARTIDVLCTHGIFCGDAVQRIKTSGFVNRIVSTNSHYEALQYEDVQVWSIADLIVSKLST